MDFELSDDQRALKDGFAALLAGRLPLSSTRAFEGAADVVDPQVWTALRDAGVFNLLVDEANGGAGLSLADATVLFEELGRVLAPGPIISTTVAATVWVPAASGVPTAMLEAPPRRSAIPTLLEHPATVEHLVVIPAIADTAADVLSFRREELSAVPVERPLDPLTPLAVVRIEDGTGVVVDASNHALRQRAMVLSAAFSVGMAAAVTELATSYAKGREQFGRPIGSFQAIKHLLADALTRTELARCAVHAAAVTIDDPQVARAEGDTLGRSDVEMRWRAVAGAKLLADEAALVNAKTAIQVHGGMGFTWEVPVHLYLKRARVLAASFGTRAELADMMAALL